MGISVWQLLLILVIVLLLFGTKKLRGIGTDLGGAVKGFRDSMGEKKAAADDNNDDDGKKEKDKLALDDAERVIDGEVTDKKSQEEKVSR